MFLLWVQLIISVIPKFLDSEIPLVSLFLELFLNQEKRLIDFAHIFLLTLYSIILLLLYQLIQLYGNKSIRYCLVATGFPSGLLKIEYFSGTSLLTGPCSTERSATISLWSFMSSILTGCLCLSAVTLSSF